MSTSQSHSCAVITQHLYMPHRVQGMRALKEQRSLNALIFLVNGELNESFCNTWKWAAFTSERDNSTHIVSWLKTCDRSRERDGVHKHVQECRRDIKSFFDHESWCFSRILWSISEVYELHCRLESVNKRDTQTDPRYTLFSKWLHLWRPIF